MTKKQNHQVDHVDYVLYVQNTYIGTYSTVEDCKTVKELFYRGQEWFIKPQPVLKIVVEPEK